MPVNAAYRGDPAAAPLAVLPAVWSRDATAEPVQAELRAVVFTSEERRRVFLVRVSPAAVADAVAFFHEYDQVLEAAPIDAFGPPGLFVVKLRDPERGLRLLARLPGKPRIEPDYLYKAQSTPAPTPDDPEFSQQHNLHVTTGPDIDLNAPEAWNALGWLAQPPAKDQVTVAVLDSGIDVMPSITPNATPSATPRLDFNERISSFRSNMVDPTPTDDVMDENGHGTAMSGIIAAIANNNAEIAGLAWGTTIVPCKMAPADTGDLVATIRCLRWVSHLVDAEHLPVTAVNFSYATAEGCSCELENEIRNLRQRQVLFVTSTEPGSASNDIVTNGPCPLFPAANQVSNIIAVTMSDANGAVQGRAGKHSVHVVAPGSDIRVPWKEGDLKTISGTSPATAQVTGLIALLKAQDSGRDWRALRNRVIAGGVPITPGPGEETISNRRIRAWDQNGLGSMTCSGQFVRRRLLPVEDTVTVNAGGSIRLRAFSINCESPIPVPVWWRGNELDTDYSSDPGAQFFPAGQWSATRRGER